MLIKAKEWPKKDLQGIWEISFKLDGVRVIIDETGKTHSRNNKPVYNIDSKLLTPHFEYEVFKDNFDVTSSIIRSKVKTSEVLTRSNCFMIAPSTDDRLVVSLEHSPTVSDVNNYLEHALKLGYEGLMLKGPFQSFRTDIETPSTWYKVKPKLTMDVTVLGFKEGTGKYKGKVGALLTSRGNVGTGLSDSERELGYFTVGDLIEVEYLNLTTKGKFRHPRFIRKRWDKDNNDDIM